MSAPNTAEPILSARWPGLAVITAGLFSAVVGLLIAISWHAHWMRLLQVFPDAAPVQYNTAFFFVLSGAGLLLLNSRWTRAAVWPAGVLTLLAALTAAEYASHADFGIDELLFHPYFEVATAFPGRMAPLTAICFLFFGVALGLAGAGGRNRKRLATAGLLATIVGTIGFIALAGYLTGIKLAYGWGAYSLMAFETAVVFLVLGAGMLICCWQAAARETFGFVHWVPIAASATLIVMVGVISAATVASLRTALGWRQHTYEVLLVAQSFLTSTTDILSGMRASGLVVKPEAGAAYAQDSRAASEKLAELLRLTRDNSAQQVRLGEVAANLTDVLSYAGRLVTAREHDGVRGEGTPESEEVAGRTERTVAVMSAFIQEEQRLLAQRSAIADADFHSTVELLGFGSGLAGLFFVAGTFLVRREIQRRNRAELELGEATDKINTLTGLLPMCAHCKSIRDDSGYWKRIEAYLQERSEVTFSHGLCENCVRELYPAIADKVLEKMREDKMSREAG